MKRHQVLLILLLALSASWINFKMYQVSRTPLQSPEFTGFADIEPAISEWRETIAILQEKTVTLQERVAALTVKLSPTPSASQERTVQAPLLDVRQTAFRSGDPQIVLASEPTTPPSGTPVETSSVRPFVSQPSPRDYWQQVQGIAATAILGTKEKTAFLQETSALIQKLEEAEANLQIEMEKAKVIQSTMFDEGVSGISAFFQVKKTIAVQMSLLAQYRRDLDSLIKPYATKKLPKISTSYLNPSAGTTTSRFSHVTAEREIVITQNQHFLVTIHFFYTDYTREPPALMNVTDNFDLNTMQSIGGQFFYPEYFVADIYELVRKLWRSQAITWNRTVTTEDLQEFLTILNQ